MLTGGELNFARVMVQRQRESGSHRYRTRDVLGLSNTDGSTCDEVANFRCHDHGNGNGTGNGDDHGHDGRAPRLADGPGPTMHHHGSTIVDRSAIPIGDRLASTPGRPRARARCIRTSGGSTVMGAPPPSPRPMGNAVSLEARAPLWSSGEIHTQSTAPRSRYRSTLGQANRRPRPGRVTPDIRAADPPPIGPRVSYDTRAPAVDRPPKRATKRFFGSVWRRDHERNRAQSSEPYKYFIEEIPKVRPLLLWWVQLSLR